MGTRNFTITKNSYHFVENVEKYIDLKSMISILPYFNTLSKKFNVSFDELCDIINILKIPHKDIFTFVQIPHGRNLPNVHIVECNSHKSITRQRNEEYTTFYDTCIGQSVFVGLCTDKIVSYILENRYPLFFKNKLFIDVVPRFKEVIEINPNWKIGDLSIDLQMQLTCQDIADIINGKVDFLNDTIEKSKIKHYDNSKCFYIPLQSVNVCGHTYEMSLSIPYKAIFEKNWELVEEVEVYSIIKLDAKLVNGKINHSSNFCGGKQKDIHYFKTKEVQEIKELFLKYL